MTLSQSVPTYPAQANHRHDYPNGEAGHPCDLCRRLPRAFVCTLSRQVMTDPFLLGPSGLSYNKSELFHYFRCKQQQGLEAVDPITNQTIKSVEHSVFSNNTLREAIREYFEVSARKVIMEEKMIHLTIMGRTAAVLNDSTVNEAATVVFGLDRPTSLFDLASGRQVDPTRPFIDQGLTGSIELVTRYDLLPLAARHLFSVVITFATGACEEEITLHNAWTGETASALLARAITAFKEELPHATSSLQSKRLSLTFSGFELPSLAPIGDFGIGPGSTLYLACDRYSSSDDGEQEEEKEESRGRWGSRAGAFLQGLDEEIGNVMWLLLQRTNDYLERASSATRTSIITPGSGAAGGGGGRGGTAPATTVRTRYVMALNGRRGGEEVDHEGSTDDEDPA